METTISKHTVCKHNYLINGEEINPIMWLCWQCCGYVIYSGLLDEAVLMETDETLRDHCTTQLKIKNNKNTSDQNVPF
jgi:hypothetical protein